MTRVIPQSIRLRKRTAGLADIDGFTKRALVFVTTELGSVFRSSVAKRSNDVELEKTKASTEAELTMNNIRFFPHPLSLRVCDVNQSPIVSSGLRGFHLFLALF